MVEPLFFAADAKKAKVGSRFTLTGAEAKHASGVRRIRAAERIQVTDGEGIRAKGLVVASSSDKVEIEISECTVEAKPFVQITLIQALAKGDRDELAVQALFAADHEVTRFGWQVLVGPQMDGQRAFAQPLDALCALGIRGLDRGCHGHHADRLGGHRRRGQLGDPEEGPVVHPGAPVDRQ